MSARFAEPCREKPLDLQGPEQALEKASQFEGRTQQEMTLRCQQDVYIGVFFDGTNNNKYRDTPAFSQSNVARLYEVYPGTPAAQKSPSLKPRVPVKDRTVERPIFKDSEYRADNISKADFTYYRKIYVPGLGTLMPDVGDSGTHSDQFFGMGSPMHGQPRLEWALIQLVNQVHAAVFLEPLDATVDIGSRWKLPLSDLARFMRGKVTSEADNSSLGSRLASLLNPSEDAARQVAFEASLSGYERRLQAALKQRGTNKPTLRKIRLSVFGFSRGAATARA